MLSNTSHVTHIIWFYGACVPASLVFSYICGGNKLTFEFWEHMVFCIIVGHIFTVSCFFFYPYYVLSWIILTGVCSCTSEANVSFLFSHTCNFLTVCM
jgi:hypothetical protein